MKNHTLALAILVSGCSNTADEVRNYDELVEQVESRKIGRDIDQWIERKNMAGEWERVGLIFGFIGDYDECIKAIAGLKRINYAAEYRCVPAN